MKIKGIVLVVALIISAASVQAQKSQVITHRGYWKTAGSTQNSITALQKAGPIRCYGSEFDVWLTKGNKLVINHDPVYKMKYMEYSRGDTLTGLKLSNGEGLLSLKQYLEAGKKCNTKLILELKALNNKKRETKTIQEVLALVIKLGLGNRIKYITFSLHAMKGFIRLAPTGTPVFYLNGELSPKELKDLDAAGLDCRMGVIKKYPEWIKEARGLEPKVSVWTVDKAEDMKRLIDQKVDFITTNEPTVVQEILKQLLLENIKSRQKFFADIR